MGKGQYLQQIVLGKLDSNIEKKLDSNIEKQHRKDHFFFKRESAQPRAVGGRGRERKRERENLFSFFKDFF